MAHCNKNGKYDRISIYSSINNIFENSKTRHLIGHFPLKFTYSGSRQWIRSNAPCIKQTAQCKHNPDSDTELRNICLFFFARSLPLVKNKTFLQLLRYYSFAIKFIFHIHYHEAQFKIPNTRPLLWKTSHFCIWSTENDVKKLAEFCLLICSLSAWRVQSKCFLRHYFRVGARFFAAAFRQKAKYKFFLFQLHRMKGST